MVKVVTQGQYCFPFIKHFKPHDIDMQFVFMWLIHTIVRGNCMKACPNCRIGRLQEVSSTYFRTFGNRLLVAPYAPANKCLICRYTDYDIEFIYAINQMVKPKSQPNPNPLSINKDVNFQRYYAHQETIKAIQ